MKIERIQPAYHQVASQLRESILRGELAPGHRLPNEAELSELFGVSRSTVREALRVLSTQNLLTTQRGVNGGSFVAHPDPSDVSDFLEASFGLLSGSQAVSIDELIEARSLLEVPAARMAAERRNREQLDMLWAAVEEEERALDSGFESHRAMHTGLLEAAGNGLVEMMTRPLFTVLRNRFLREPAPRTFWKEVADDHRAIVECVDAADGDGAAAAMAAHLDHLRVIYERMDRMAREQQGQP